MKENISHYLRIFGAMIVLTLIASLVVLLIGFLAHWSGSNAFSNGFFAGGAVIIVIGLVSMTGNWGLRGDFTVLYGESAGSPSIAERTQILAAEILQGPGAAIFFVGSGILMVVIAALISTVWHAG